MRHLKLMIRLLPLSLAAAFLMSSPAIAETESVTAPAATQTVTGIALDAPWKRAVYSFAQEKLLHPAWGWTHSERDYRMAVDIAAREKLAIDTDVLFAAAFTHDIGAIGDFQKEGVDHAERSVELAEPLLRDAGFPMEKWPAVREAILGHMHDKPVGGRPESVVLHDADALDFLGLVGVTRRISVTGTEVSTAGGLEKIKQFAEKLPGRVVTPTARSLAAERSNEMLQYLETVRSETAEGRLP